MQDNSPLPRARRQFSLRGLMLTIVIVAIWLAIGRACGPRWFVCTILGAGAACGNYLSGGRNFVSVVATALGASIGVVIPAFLYGILEMWADPGFSREFMPMVVIAAFLGCLSGGVMGAAAYLSNVCGFGHGAEERADDYWKSGLAVICVCTLLLTFFCLLIGQ